MPYTGADLTVRPLNETADPDLIVRVTPQRAGWDFIHFQARRLGSGSQWSFKTGEYELALVAFGGSFDVASSRGDWSGIGERANVFAGLPHAIYLPRRTSLTVTATSDCEFAAAWAPAEQ